MTKQQLIYIKNKFLHRYDRSFNDEYENVKQDLIDFQKNNIPSYRCDFKALNRNKYSTKKKSKVKNINRVTFSQTQNSVFLT